jgi:exodeoxyribonuclease VII small subunit
MSYEQAIMRIEEILSTLSTGKVTLDESLKLYAEGTKLLETCEQQLNEAKLQIETLTAQKGE